MSTNTVDFISISARNFCSIGDMPIKIQLDRSPTTWIKGRSGSGKSALILDALTFALYGKAFRDANKPTLVNTTNNKNCVVECVFRVNRGNKIYRVVRGIAPTVFQIYENDRLVNINDKSRDYQAVLTNDILKIKENVFRQIIALGSSTFVAFMDQPAAVRRAIIEDILDTKIFSDMLTIHKERLDALKASFRDVEYKLEVANERKAFIENAIREQEQQSSEKIEQFKEKLFELIQQIEQADQEISVFLDEKKNLTSLKRSLEEKTAVVPEIESVLGTLKTSRAKIKKEIAFLTDNAQCPTCHQEIDAKFRDAHVCQQKAELEQTEETQRKLARRLETLNAVLNELSSVNKKIQLVEKKISAKEAEKKVLEARRDIFVDNIHEKKTETQADVGLEATKKEIAELQESRSRLLETREYYGYISTILKDDGVKAQVVSQYLPMINTTINEYLDFFDLNCGIVLSSDFSETFTQNGKVGLRYGNLSQGQKARVDLALIFTFRELAKRRHSVSTNLLVLDEIGAASMGQDVTEMLIELLHKMSENDNVNIFCASHDPAYSALRSTITVEMKGLFTVVT